MSSQSRIAVIIGSVREHRTGEQVASWMVDQINQFGGFDIDLIDLRDEKLSHVQSDAHPKTGNYPEHVIPFAQRIGAAHGFVLITPEYNHGYPASVKAALDSIYKEWNAKPMTFVSYGGVAAGTRAVEQLREVCGELHLVDIRDAVHLPFVSQLWEDDGSMKPNSAIDAMVQATLTSLAWWANALRQARETTPYP